jgi:hypothetical protein
VPDRVCVVCTGFLEQPIEVVCGWPRLMLVTVCGSQVVPHAGATRLPVIVVIVVSCGRGPLKALHAPLFATLDALSTAMDGNVRRRSLAAARGHLPASLSWVKHDRLVASPVLGGDAVRHLECVPAKVAMLAPERALCAALGLRAYAPLVSLVARMWLNAPTLPPQRGLGREVNRE